MKPLLHLLITLVVMTQVYDFGPRECIGWATISINDNQMVLYRKRPFGYYLTESEYINKASQCAKALGYELEFMNNENGTLQFIIRK